MLVCMLSFIDTKIEHVRMHDKLHPVYADRRAASQPSPWPLGGALRSKEAQERTDGMKIGRRGMEVAN